MGPMRSSLDPAQRNSRRLERDLGKTLIGSLRFVAMSYWLKPPTAWKHDLLYAKKHSKAGLHSHLRNKPSAEPPRCIIHPDSASLYREQSMGVSPRPRAFGPNAILQFLLWRNIRRNFKWANNSINKSKDSHAMLEGNYTFRPLCIDFDLLTTSEGRCIIKKARYC